MLIQWRKMSGSFKCYHIKALLHIIAPQYGTIEGKSSGDHGNLPRSSTKAWWRHQMETFYALLSLCTGNSPVTGEFPAQRPVARSFEVFFDLRLNKRFSKQWWGWWFETPWRPLWRCCEGDNYRESIFMPSYPSVDSIIDHLDVF